jgi:hypothetical protein
MNTSEQDDGAPSGFPHGDLKESVVKNYLHNERRPDYMPSHLTELASTVTSIAPVIEQAI